jgi:hypothetical protein
MRGRCAVPRTLFQCVCTPHRNRIGRLSPFTEYAPSASRLKPNRSPQSKVTHSPDWRAQHRSNGKVRASFGMHIVLLMRPAYADGNDMDVNRFKRKYQRSRRRRLTGAKRTLCGNADISVSGPEADMTAGPTDINCRANNGREAGQVRTFVFDQIRTSRVEAAHYRHATGPQSAT